MTAGPFVTANKGYELFYFVVVFLEVAAGSAFPDCLVESEASFILAVHADEEIGLGDDIVDVLGVVLDGFVPIHEGGIEKSVFGFEQRS